MFSMIVLKNIYLPFVDYNSMGPNNLRLNTMKSDVRSNFLLLKS